MPKPMKVAAIQCDTVWEDPQATLARLDPWVAAAATAGARLVALPEMFACGFTMRTDRVAEPPDGPTAEFLQSRARDHGLWMAGSFPELAPEAAKPSNTLLIAGPDGELHRYRKIKPFTYAGEHEAFEAGQDLVTVEIEGVRWSLFICYDLRFADLFWQVAPATDAYLVVANWPEPRRAHWTALLQARAIENQAYVVGVNRVGDGGSLHYTGDSHILDPLGKTLAQGSHGATLLLAEIDPDHVRQTRKALPFLADR